MKIITGKTKDKDGFLPFVNISIKGTSKGTTSGSFGDFSLSVLPEDVLVFSFVGYQNQEVSVQNAPEPLTVLLEGTTELKEVVLKASYPIVSGKIQPINATLMDDLFGSGIEGVEVKNTTTNTLVKSDAKGRYSIKAANTHRLTFSKVGYMPQSLIAKAETINVRLDFEVPFIIKFPKPTLPEPTLPDVEEKKKDIPVEKTFWEKYSTWIIIALVLIIIASIVQKVNSKNSKTVKPSSTSPKIK